MSSNPGPLIIGVSGGTGSGKTTFSRVLMERVGEKNIAYLSHDRYYKDIDDIPLSENGLRNFDHPNALDTDILIANIKDLLQRKPTSTPVYDFREYKRLDISATLLPQPILLVEGILVFAEPQLRELLDVKVYLDADADVRFIRRLQRDMTERGRTVESVIEQYMNTVRPMHFEFVEPNKRYADVIVPGGGYNSVAIDLLTERIRSLLAERSPHS